MTACRAWLRPSAIFWLPVVITPVVLARRADEPVPALTAAGSERTIRLSHCLEGQEARDTHPSFPRSPAVPRPIPAGRMRLRDRAAAHPGRVRRGRPAHAASPAAGRTWHGTVTSTATVLYHTGGVTSGPYTGSYAGTLALAEDAAGAITGHVRVSASGCHIGGGKPATAINFNVTGTDSEGLLRLQLVITSFRINGTNCGFGDGWYPPQPGISVTQASAGIPVGPPGTARASWTVFAYHPSGKWTVHYQVDLTCTGCGGS